MCSNMYVENDTCIQSCGSGTHTRTCTHTHTKLFNTFRSSGPKVHVWSRARRRCQSNHGLRFAVIFSHADGPIPQSLESGRNARNRPAGTGTFPPAAHDYRSAGAWNCKVAQDMLSEQGGGFISFQTGRIHVFQHIPKKPGSVSPGEM